MDIVDMIPCFIIENKNNASYINTILISLFYKMSKITQELLETDIMNEAIYLQKYILENIVDKFKANVSISSDIINELQYISYLLGWNTNFGIFDDKTLSELSIIPSNSMKFDSIEKNMHCEKYLEFLLSLLGSNISQINTPCNRLSQSPRYRECPHETNTFINDKMCSHIMSLPSMPSIQQAYNVRKKNIVLSSVPSFIIFKIQYHEQLAINKKIKLFNKSSIFSEYTWVFHSLFYEHPLSKQSFAFISHNNNIFFYDNNTFPCLSPIKKFNETLKDIDLYVIYTRDN